MGNPNLSEIMDVGKLEGLISQRYISRRPHLSLPLFIYNYTASAVYDRVWTAETLQCRGLIVDDKGAIVGRPFPKIFNYGEVRLPNFALSNKPQVTSKIDGSLFIVARYHDDIVTATRGSFSSEQADQGRLLLQDRSLTIEDGITYLFEVVYPSNRIVISYDYSDLVLLAAIDTTTGADCPLATVDYDGPRVEYHDCADAQEAYMLATSNEFADAEGVVMCWPRYQQPSFRAKAKHPDYIRLHALFTQTSTKTIWRSLKDGTFYGVIEQFPDELYQWVKAVADELTEGYNKYLSEAQALFDSMQHLSSRKAFAQEALKSPYKSALFALLDDKSISDMAWDSVEPEYSRPFSVDEPA